MRTPISPTLVRDEEVALSRKRWLDELCARVQRRAGSEALQTAVIVTAWIEALRQLLAKRQNVTLDCALASGDLRLTVARVDDDDDIVQRRVLNALREELFSSSPVAQLPFNIEIGLRHGVYVASSCS